ncbi:unnamed protein product [Orchesella dallaii]|uniref:Uncharacterized protein n=1 Tax=Orchesella dallaii TaxID=48710 RepID=A0ABP1QJ72_9HEXA
MQKRCSWELSSFVLVFGLVFLIAVGTFGCNRNKMLRGLVTRMRPSNPDVQHSSDDGAIVGSPAAVKATEGNQQLNDLKANPKGRMRRDNKMEYGSIVFHPEYFPDKKPRHLESEERFLNKNV